MSMLQMVPMVSKEKAKALLTKYSCPLKLLHAYEDASLSSIQKQELLQHDFHIHNKTSNGNISCSSSANNAANGSVKESTKANKARCEVKISRLINALFQQSDPDAPLI